MGGAVARVGEGDTAFPERSMPFVLNAVTGWQDPDETAAHTAWARTVIAAAPTRRPDAPTSTSSVTPTRRGRRTGPTPTRASLALKREYDPTNVFRLNQNIEPDAGQ